MKKFFIQEQANATFLHGGVGIVDAEKILIAEGYQPLRFPYHFSFSFIAKVARLFYLMKLAMNIPNSSVVVFIFPMHARMNRMLIDLLRRKRDVKIICFIADIDGLKDGNDILLEKEIRYLKKFRQFIVHNEAMKEWLENSMGEKKVAMIEFFDFLAKPLQPQRSKSYTLVFAGNLSKSGFLSRVEALPLKFSLYGQPVSREMIEQTNVDYKGVYDPYELPSMLEGSFGLVWDGESAEGMGGSLGYYMQYISHHKLSLYILAGLPVITSCHAGSAQLVKKYGIGFCVDDLRDVKSMIDDISEEQYQAMIFNMKLLAKRISEGGCLKKALAELGS